MNRLPQLTQTDLHLTDEQFYALLDSPQESPCPTFATASSSLRWATTEGRPLPPISTPQTPLEKAATHLSTCLDCQAEFATISASLANFRNATVSFAAIRTPALAQTASLRKTSASHRPIWAVATATAALLLGVSVSMHRNPLPVVTPVAIDQPVTQTESDEALLDDIQRDLSTSVAPSLQPLQIPASN